MEKITLDKIIEPVYTKIKVNGKPRRVRRFGAVTFTDKNDKVKIIQEAGYYFIKDEPKTRYTESIDDLHPKDKQVKKSDTK